MINDERNTQTTHEMVFQGEREEPPPHGKYCNQYMKITKIWLSFKLSSFTSLFIFHWISLNKIVWAVIGGCLLFCCCTMWWSWCCVCTSNVKILYLCSFLGKRKEERQRKNELFCVFRGEFLQKIVLLFDGVIFCSLLCSIP